MRTIQFEVPYETGIQWKRDGVPAHWEFFRQQHTNTLLVVIRIKK